MHPDVVGARDGHCRTVGTTAHHRDCSRFGFTHANEVSCTARSGVPDNVKNKCIHEIPNSKSLSRYPDGWYKVTKGTVEFVPLRMVERKSKPKPIRKSKSKIIRKSKRKTAKKAVKRSR